jgi:hypothetical protein
VDKKIVGRFSRRPRKTRFAKSSKGNHEYQRMANIDMPDVAEQDAETVCQRHMLRV